MDHDLDQMDIEDEVDPSHEILDAPGDDNDDAADAVPLYLREISSLASWTVSSFKPGCGVSALRHPSTAFFWQSDGPLPHTLNIHFFKLVSIAHMRIFLDCVLDESYTPTKMTFLAGTGHHDLQVVTEMQLAKPRGWIEVDLSQAGGPDIFDDLGIEESRQARESALDHLIREMEETSHPRELRGRANPVDIITKGFGPTLRCFLVQVKIYENHQNGKDTHLRGLQVFARDPALLKRFKPMVTGQFTRDLDASAYPASDSIHTQVRRKVRPAAVHADFALRQAPWMDEPTLR